jgi:predicted RNA-binding Zn-ribbon protein involved in translation (DUF1610 family)
MKISLVNQKSDKEFISLFRSSHTETEFAYSLGIYNFGGGTYSALKKRCDLLGLDRESQWQGALKKSNGHFFLKRDEYFAKNTSRTGKSTRQRILKEKLLPYRCALCGNPGEWQGKKLALEVDHINGDHFDNRLENLRFLCPNCHALTETFSGKNPGRKRKRPSNGHFVFLQEPGSKPLSKERRCARCGKPITRWSKRNLCPECAAFMARKVSRPDSRILLKEVYQKSCAWAARKYGVVESVIRKWLEESSLPSHKEEIRAYIHRYRPSFPKERNNEDKGQ